MAQSGSAQPEQEGLPRPENANARGSKGSDTQTVNLSTRSHWVLSAMFLAVSAIGFWLFSRGFLLTRMVLPDHSLSSALPFTPEQTFGPVPGGSSKELRPCGWYPPKFDRTIVLVVDALRIDFATWSDALNSTDVGPDSHTPLRLKPYHNRLPVIDALTKQHPEQAMLYRFRADPPTTTLQRLKGLTTGQLPTFIDAGSNFAGSAIDEDNWIQALRWPSIYTCNQTADSSGPNKGHKRNLVFLGDDTWSSLFPQELSDTFTKEASDGTVPEFEANGTGIRGWARVRPFPSLNVWDLDTVDDGVISRLPMFLLPPTQLDQSLSTEEAAGMQAKREQWRQLVKQPATFSHSDFAADGSVNTMASTRVGLKQLHEEWDVMIAHCLGVDHCGHRFGPDHPAISQKLRQMNQVIELIVDSINKSNRSTALYVFGDHGMDPKGDHGGDSPREVDAALWVYSNTKWNTKKGAERTSRVLKRTKEILESEPLGATLDDDLKDGWWENTHLSDDYWSKDDGYLFQPQRLRSIPQIDLVSSLTLSLGLPVPFNSLGAVIPEMFASDDSVNGEWGLLHALRLNSAQVMRYLTTYMSNSRSHGFSDDVVQLWKDMYARAEKSYKDFRDVAVLKPKGSAVSDAEEAAAAQYYAFLRIMLGTLRQMWAQFDPVLMLAGLCVLVLSIVSLALVYVQSRQITLESIVDRAWRTCLSGGVSGMIIARALATVLVSNTSSHISSLESAVGGLAIGLTVSFCAAALTSKKPGSATFSAFTSGWIHIDAGSALNCIAFAMAILHGFTFVSNSYTFNEDSIVLYLAQSLTLAVAAVVLHSASSSSSLQQNAAGQRALWCTLAIIVLNRVSSSSTVCREEQIPGCIPTFYGSPSASISSVPLALANAAMVWFVPFVVQRFLMRSRSDKAMVARLWVSIGMRVSMGMAAAYWLLDSIDGQLSLGTPTSSSSSAATTAAAAITTTVPGSGSDSDWSELRTVLARMAIGIALGGGFAAWYSSPFCLDVAITSVPQTSPITASSKAKAKAKAKSDNPDPPRQTAVILGYGNAYGAAYLIFVTVVFCVLYLVQQPMGGIMLSFLFIKLMFCAELFDALRDVLNKNGLDSVSLLPAQIILLALLSYLDYFSTGHQFTLVSIQWSTAFVGVREMHLVICGLIVGLNTFGSFIFTALCVPLVVLWNVSLGSQLLRIAPAHYFAQIAGAGSAYAAYHALTASTTAIFAAWFRRHLMVWKIFAPRFMFSAPVFLISATAVLVIAAGLAAVRILRMGLKVGNVQALVAQKMARHA